MGNLTYKKVLTDFNVYDEETGAYLGMVRWCPVGGGYDWTVVEPHLLSYDPDNIGWFPEPGYKTRKEAAQWIRAYRDTWEAIEKRGVSNRGLPIYETAGLFVSGSPSELNVFDTYDDAEDVWDSQIIGQVRLHSKGTWQAANFHLGQYGYYGAFDNWMLAVHDIADKARQWEEGMDGTA